MGIFNSFSGMVAVKIINADCARILDEINKNGIKVFRVTEIDELTVQFQLLRKDLSEIEDIVLKRDGEIHLLHRYGIYWVYKGLLARPCLIIGLLVILAVTFYLPTRILFIRVEGNARIPSNLILEQAEACGIVFGSSRREVRSERVKNNLLGAIPQLQWIGVNTYGCTAVISVKEKTAAQSRDDAPGVSSIIAARDGVIVSATVTKGNALCKPGQAVKAGQVLISGYTDCGVCIKATRAQAEILAQTTRELTAVSPLTYIKREESSDTKKYYSIILGRNQICVGSEGSGNETLGYKTRSEYPITLPGGFVLPITLVIETVQSYENTESVSSDETAKENLDQYLRTYINQRMVGGVILTETTEFTIQQAVGYMSGKYACLEMIGVEKAERKLTMGDSVP